MRYVCRHMYMCVGIGAIPGGTGRGIVPPNLEGWGIVACIPPKIVGTLPECRRPPIINAELHHCVLGCLDVRMPTYSKCMCV